MTDGLLDLVVLVSDTNMEHTLDALLGRHAALRVNELALRIYRHPQNDPGCLNQGAVFLRPFARQYRHCLLVLDHEGCGRETSPAEELEAELDGELQRNGWDDRAAAIVIEPELESWIWGPSTHVADALGWGGRRRELERLLREHDLLGRPGTKPHRPKEAIELALRRARKPRSSAVYRRIAERASLERCRDRALLRLRRILKGWFGGSRAAHRASE